MFFFQVCLASEKEIKTSVFFETDRHELTAPSTQKLSAFLQNELNNSDYEIIVQGYADPRGNVKYNDSLSLRRANEVSEYLAKQGIAKALISISFFGERKSNSNTNELSVERRVDVIVKKYQFNSTQDLQNALQEKSTSRYIIDPKTKTVLTAKHGSKVLIRPNSFVSSEGAAVHEPIEIEIIEGMSVEECLANELSTTTKDGLIVSGGMIKVEARTTTGEKLELKEGESIVAALPNLNKRSVDQRMELFDLDTTNNWVSKKLKPMSERNLKLPKYPVRRIPPFNAPKFKVDSKSMPKPPKKPVRPRQINEMAEFDPYEGIRWYTFNKDEKVNSNIIQHHRQATLYRNRKERFDKREFRYNQKVLQYERDVRRHRAKLDAWRDSVELARKTWKRTPQYQAAIREYDSLDNIYYAQFQEKVLQYNAIRRKKLEQLAAKMDDIGVTDYEALSTYVIEMNEMRWMNVDRFYHVPASQIMAYTLHSSDTIVSKTMLVYEEIRSSVMLNDFEKKGVYEAKVINREPATVFSYRVKDGRPEIYFESLVNSEQDLEIAYRPSSFAEIKMILDSFKKRV